MDLPNFSVTIDADVEVLENNTFPVYSVEGISFSKQPDTLQSVLDLLIPDADGVRSGEITREECLDKIIYLKMGHYHDELMEYVSYTSQEQKEVDAEILTLSELMETAPSEDDYAPLTGGLCTDVSSDFVYQTKSEKLWEVKIDDSSVSISQPGTSSYPESWFINHKATPESPAPTPPIKISPFRRKKRVPLLVISFPPSTMIPG